MQYRIPHNINKDKVKYRSDFELKKTTHTLL